MFYYEIIVDNELIGVGTTSNMVMYQKKHNILLACDEKKAEYIMCEDALYHADWMLAVNKDSFFEYQDAQVVTIDEDTYNSLMSAIENNEQIEIQQEEEETIEDVPVYEEGEEVTLEYIMSSKIAEMSNTCNAVIVNGFDVVLSDEETYHFSLTTQDQLNLITLTSLIQSGATVVPYHADGELCRYYSADDISTITEYATFFKTYHTSYYNSLKNYIQSLTEIADISAIYYGMEIPTEFISDVLLELMAVLG